MGGCPRPAGMHSHSQAILRSCPYSLWFSSCPQPVLARMHGLGLTSPGLFVVSIDPLWL